MEKIATQVVKKLKKMPELINVVQLTPDKSLPVFINVNHLPQPGKVKTHTPKISFHDLKDFLVQKQELEDDKRIFKRKTLKLIHKNFNSFSSLIQKTLMEAEEKMLKMVEEEDLQDYL